MSNIVFLKIICVYPQGNFIKLVTKMVQNYWCRRIIILLFFKTKYPIKYIIFQKYIFAYIQKHFFKITQQDINNGYFWAAEILHVLHSFLLYFLFF